MGRKENKASLKVETTALWESFLRTDLKSQSDQAKFLAFAYAPKAYTNSLELYMVRAHKCRKAWLECDT